MSPRKRIAVALTLTGALVTLMAVLVVVRMQHWQRRGLTGVSYVQVMKDGKAPPNLFPTKPGQVLIVYPSGPGERAGIRSRDEILSINGIGLTDHEALRALNARLQTGDEVHYRLRRGGTEHAISVALQPLWPHPLLVISTFVYATVAAAFIAIGLLVFTRAPADRRSTVFYAMVTAGALSLLGSIVGAIDMGTFRGITSDAEPNALALVLMGVMSLTFFPLTLHLALVFPKDRPSLRRNARLLRWVYGPLVFALLIVGFFTLLSFQALRNPDGEARWVGPLIHWGTAAVALFGLLVALRVARKARTEGVRDAFWFRPLQSQIALFALLVAATRILAGLKLKWAAVGMGIFTVAIVPLIVVMGYPVLICLLLYRSYRESDAEERRQVKWPLWGTLIAIGSKIVFSIGIYLVMFTVMGLGRDLTPFMRVSTIVQLIPILLYLLIPISFAVAILKYRLMNIDLIIKKTVVYAILSGAVIVLYLILVGGLGTVLVAVTGLQNQTMVVVSTLVVAALFVPLRNRLQHLVDRNLFRERIDYPQALRSISAQTVAASDVGFFLKSTAEKLQQALQNRAVVLFQRRGEELVATAKVGVADSILGATSLSAATAAGFDRPLDPRRRELPDPDAAALRRIEASLVVPVRSHGTVVGLIALAPKLSDQEYDLDDIEFATSVADQVAIGIDRIRVQHDEADFEQARALQQRLLPAEVPQLPGVDVAGVWQPARTVGGDYYDLLELSQTQLAICIGDVAGKGMPAALLMSGLQAAVRASADADVSPSRVCERVRRVIVPSLGGRFVTFFYCMYDTRTRVLRYCNAGHNPPIVVRHDGSRLRLATGGPVLSRLFRDAPLQEGEVELAQGDRLLLFTDGVSEARDDEATDFGEDRLEELVVANRAVSAEELIGSIVAAVSAYAGGRTDDDLTVVALGVTA